MKQLTIKNCHRAAEVVRDGKTYEFAYNGERESSGMFRTTYSHRLTCGDEQVIVANNNDAMAPYMVSKWKYEENFEDMYELAARAYTGTSFSPEERALYYIKDYEAGLQNDIKDMPEEYKSAYVEKYRGWVRTLFSKHSSIVSPVIAGSANFPVRRMERANNSYDNAVQDFCKWRETYHKRMLRSIENAKSPEQRQSEEFKTMRIAINDCAGTCSDIDLGKNRYSSRALFTSSVYGKIERLANNGHAETVKECLEYIRKVTEEMKEKGLLKKDLFTSRHKIWKLEEQCAAAIEKKAEREGREDEEFTFDGGKVVKNYTEDRLQVFHDEKPQPDVISKLKHEGFRWSRYFGCWQRQLTSNAVYAAGRVLYSDDNDKRESFLSKLLK